MLDKVGTHGVFFTVVPRLRKGGGRTRSKPCVFAASALRFGPGRRRAVSSQGGPR